MQKWREVSCNFCLRKMLSVNNKGKDSRKDQGGCKNKLLQEQFRNIRSTGALKGQSPCFEKGSAHGPNHLENDVIRDT
jgi:hypothetical protein